MIKKFITQNSSIMKTLKTLRNIFILTLFLTSLYACTPTAIEDETVNNKELIDDAFATGENGDNSVEDDDGN